EEIRGVGSTATTPASLPATSQKAASDRLKTSPAVPGPERSAKFTAGHALLAAAALILLWRSLGQAWVDEVGGDPIAARGIRLILPISSAAASCFMVGLGYATARSRSALIADAMSLGGAILFVFGLALGPASRDVAGMLVVTFVAVRLAPAIWFSVRSRAAWVVAFALTFAGYGLFGGWHQVASLPLGDQVHYLLATDR